MVPADEAAAMAPAWRDLMGRALEANPFFHPDFLLPAMAAFDGGRVRLATVWGIDGRLLALAPVVACRLGRIAPAVAVWVHDYGPRGTPLVDAELAEHALSCLAVGLGREFGRSRPVVLPFLELGGAFAGLLCRLAEGAGRQVETIGQHRRARYVRREQAPDPRAELETRRRKEFARQMRRLGEMGQLTVTSHRGGDVVGQFEAFLALEADGWKGERGTAMAADPSLLGFARQAVSGLGHAGLCQIDAIRLDGRPVAMLVSLMAGDLAVTWKIAHDESLARFSPGAQMMLEATRSLFESPAIQRLDSLATADHPMIDRLWRDRLDVATLVLTPAERALSDQLGLASTRLEMMLRRRLTPRLRRWRGQRSGAARTRAQ